MSTNMNINYNLLKIGHEAMVPYIVAAFSMVYGTQYQVLIKKRCEKGLFLPYLNLEGIEDYTKYLKKAKSKELAVEFLKRIGYSVPDKEDLNFADNLDTNLERLINNYLGPSEYSFNNDSNSPTVPLKLFSDDCLDKENIVKKVRLINQLRGRKENLVVYQTLKDFEKTDEYIKIKDSVLQLERIYNDLKNEFTKWEEEIKHYNNFILEEKLRKKEIFSRGETALYNEILGLIPTPLKERINHLPFEEQIHILIGEDFTRDKSVFAAFSQKNMDSLCSEDTPLYEKYWIVNEQITLFRRLGIEIPDEKILGCGCEENVQEYKNFLNKDEIKALIPDANSCEKIANSHQSIAADIIKKYNYTNVSFRKIISLFSDDCRTKEYFYRTIKERTICVSVFTENNPITNHNSVIPFLCYTVRPGSAGRLAYTLMHEFGHIIDYSENGSAFETIEDLGETNKSINPYDNRYRIYERFNETINDIFALEAIEILNSKGIYLLEEKKLTSVQLENLNTNKILKDMLRPLIKKFRKHIVEVKLTSRRNKLTDYIGEKNIYDLVDAINKVDYFITMGLCKHLEAGLNTSIVQNYYKELERVNEIYLRIDDYYNRQINNLDVKCYKKS